MDDSGPSADTCFNIAAFSQRTHKMPSTYVYKSVVSDLVLAKFEAAGKASRQTLLRITCFTGHVLCGHIATFTKLSPYY